MIPVTYTKVEPGTIGGPHRLIDASTVGNLVQKHLGLLKMGQAMDDSIQLPSYYAKIILNQMSASWGQLPVRYFP